MENTLKAKSGERAVSSTSSSSRGSDCQEVREDFQALMEDVGTSISSYCHKRPAVAAVSLFAIGLYIGWKIKPW